MTEFYWIPGYEGRYSISADGEVYLYVRNRFLTPSTQNNGYRTVHLSKGGESRVKSLHRLVAETFHGQPPSPGVFACHRDGNKENNSKSNIYWGTPRQNQQDRVEHGTTYRGEDHHSSKLSVSQVRDIYRRICKEESLTALANEYDVSLCSISDIKSKRSWKWLTDELDAWDHVHQLGQIAEMDSNAISKFIYNTAACFVDTYYGDSLDSAFLEKLIEDTEETRFNYGSTGTAPEGDDPASDQASDE
jgi:hypothetical protein